MVQTLFGMTIKAKIAIGKVGLDQPKVVASIESGIDDNLQVLLMKLSFMEFVSQVHSFVLKCMIQLQTPLACYKCSLEDVYHED